MKKKTSEEISEVLNKQGLDLDPKARKELDAIVEKYKKIVEKLYLRFTREMMKVCIADFVIKEMIKMGVINEKERPS